MKKKEIIELLNAKKILLNNRNLLKSIDIVTCNDKDFFLFAKKEDRWYPNIPELKQEFDTLKQELKEKLEESRKKDKIIKENNCSHEVRMKYHKCLGVYDNKCVLCGNISKSDNEISFYESNYRNKHTVTFEYLEQEGDYGEKYVVKNGVTEEEVINLIIKILDKYNLDDDVDLVEEFSKLNLNNCEINKEERYNEDYILIIGGTNQEYLNKDVYVSKRYESNSIEVFNYFIDKIDTKVVLIDNIETISKTKYIEEIKRNGKYYNDNILIDTYDTIKELKRILNNLKKIKFKQVINISDINNYKVNRNVSLVKYDLDLDKLFPNSEIIEENNIKKIVKNYS